MATDVGAMFDRALSEPRLSHLGESLETARRLYGVGNYVYCRDLVGYLLQQHPDLADGDALRGIYDELEGLAIGPSRSDDPDETNDEELAGDEEEDDDSEGGLDIPRRGARVVHTLGTGARISPRSRPSGHFGGAAAREPTPPPEPTPPSKDETPVVRAIDPRPAPTPPPRRSLTPPEPSVEVEGRPVLPEWRPPPTGGRRNLPAPTPARGSALPAPVARREVVRYEDRSALPSVAVIEGTPARIGFAFGVGILVGALAVVLLMDRYREAMQPHPAISARPVIVRHIPRTSVRVLPATSARPAVQPWASSTPLPLPIPSAAVISVVEPDLPRAQPAHGVSELLPPPALPAPLVIPGAPGIGTSLASVVAAATAPPVLVIDAAIVNATKEARAAPRPPPRKRPRPKVAKAKKPALAKTGPTAAGRIIVETKPPSRGKVMVTIDGKDRGTAPLKVKVEPGVHEIQTVQGTGYPEMRMVRVKPGGLARVVVPLAK